MSGENPEESDDAPHYSEAIGTRVSPGTHDRFEQYRDTHGYTNAEALRTLIRTALDYNDGELSPSLPKPIVLGIIFELAAVASIAFAFALDYLGATVPSGFLWVPIGLVFLSVIAFVGFLSYRSIM